MTILPFTFPDYKPSEEGHNRPHNILCFPLSKTVMASSSPANQDLQEEEEEEHHISDHNSNLISMNMDDLLKNIYDVPMSGGDPEMTLEDYLMKAGAVREEDVVPVSKAVVVSEYIDPNMCGGGLLQQQHMQFGNISGGGRGKRKVIVEDPPVDKATQQKQRRMIKNRESAARSRERKQAYTVELESLVTQLEEEHARLLKEVDELNKERLKQLMEKLMPVVEKRRPPRVLRRTNSM